MPGLAVCVDMYSLETDFPLKSTNHLLVKYAINLPRVINTSCYSQGHLSAFWQTGREAKMSEAYTKTRQKTGAFL